MSEVVVTGPYVDTKGSNALPFAVCVYVKGVSSTVHRFAKSDEAVAFAQAQGGETEHKEKVKRVAAQMAKSARKAATEVKR